MIRWVTADVFDGLATLEDGSVDLVVTSPPFLALRSYLPADHPDKGKEIGSEATPAVFLDVLLRVTAELRRVLAPHGSICVELGDTYAGSGNGPDALKPESNGAHDLWLDKSVPKRIGQGWPLAKSKTLIPELYRIALAYGFNPLTGEPSPAGRWRVRNVVTWCRPNPPVGALGDKWRPATSDIVVACRSSRRFWDDLATRRNLTDRASRELNEGRITSGLTATTNDPTLLSSGMGNGIQNPSGAPLLDYWEIPPTGYAGAHYAVYPPALVEPLVKAMCPERVCRTCGEPSRRIVEREAIKPDGSPVGSLEKAQRRGVHIQNFGTSTGHDNTKLSRVVSEEWTDCGHDDWRPGVVLDPFAGSGTTLAVASGHGHDTIGFDLDPRNEDLARERVGPLMWETV